MRADRARELPLTRMAHTAAPVSSKTRMDHSASGQKPPSKSFSLSPMKITAALRAVGRRKLGAGMVGLARPVVEVEEVASHGPGNAVRPRIVAEHPDADLPLGGSAEEHRCLPQPRAACAAELEHIRRHGPEPEPGEFIATLPCSTRARAFLVKAKDMQRTRAHLLKLKTLLDAEIGKAAQGRQQNCGEKECTLTV